MVALVLGAGGQLGSELMRLIPGAVGLSRHQLSITDVPGLDRACVDHRPTVVFNCAAYNAVDAAEGDPQQAFKVNSDGPANLGATCNRHGAQLVHFSTNFVFDGSLDRPYVESDPVNPLGVYGKSKLEGEQRLLTIMPGALVIRSAALFGDSGPSTPGRSFPDRILARARSGEGLRVVSDQRVNPTYARDLAATAVKLAERRTTGLLHVVAEGCCAWDEFARAALAECGVRAQVQAVMSAEVVLAARRPLNGCLASERTGALRPWQEGLHEWALRRAGDPGLMA